MVRKCVVLLRIKYLEQSACRIAAVIFSQFIDFVQYHDRVGGAASLHCFHDPAGHCPYISPSVSADLCLIADTAQADADIFPAEGLCNTLADAGLARAGGADEEQDRTVLFPVQRHDRELLDDTFFDFFKAIVILVKYLFCPFQVDGSELRRFPGEACYKIKIVIEESVLVALFAFLTHAVQHFIRLTPCLFVHSGLLNLFLKFPDVGYILRMHLVQFFLEIVDLLLQRGFAVELFLIAFLSFLCFGRNPCDLHELSDSADDQAAPFSDGVSSKDLIFIIRCQVQIF